jgi:ABC-type glycerol-3-phosphate transport system substrate-binding protein
VGNIAERRGTVDASWEFLKWFTSEEAQDRFALDVEAVFGHNWRYQTANLASFRNLGWGDMWPVMEETLNWAIPIPQVPGGYIAGREIHNAFINVIVDNGNPINALLIARDRIDNELTAKRREFGLE